LHHNAIRIGGELRPVFGSYFCSSIGLSMRIGLRNAMVGARKLVSGRRGR